MNFNNFLQWNYYTEINPQGDFLWGYLILIFFVLVFMSKGFAENIAGNDKYAKKSIKKVFLKFKFLGAIGIILILGRFAEIKDLSTRLWLAIVLVITFILLIKTIWQSWKAYKIRIKSVTREVLKK
jgi:hypothetical protein